MSLPAIVVPKAFRKDVTEMKIVTKRRLVDAHNQGATKALGRGSGGRRLSRYSSGVLVCADSDVGDSVMVTGVFKIAPILDAVALRPRKCA